MKKHIVFLLTLLSGFFFGLVHSQTLIINEVSNGPAGSQEYVEFVVVDENTVASNQSQTPPLRCLPCSLTGVTAIARLNQLYEG